MLTLSGIGVATAFLAGVISFLSPCVLPLVPGYLSYVAGGRLDDLERCGGWRPRLAAVRSSVVFVLGFSLVFIALGAERHGDRPASAGLSLSSHPGGRGIIAVFGVFMTGLLPLPWLQRDFRFRANLAGGRTLAAFVLGLAFAFGWTPCIGPVLGAILAVSATSARMADGVSLLAVYSLGLGLPFLAAAAFATTFVERMKSVRWVGRALQVGAGTVMVIMGIAMITGNMSLFAIWLLQTFPILQRIG